MPFTPVFGGNNIYPSSASYLAVALSADDITLEWPLDNGGAEYPAAAIIDVTSANSRTIVLPPANEAGPGQVILFNNLAASSSAFTIDDAAGNTLATVDVGEQWQFYLADASTVAGTWRVFMFGASTATVQPADLAGHGITVTSNQLSQSTPVTTFNTTPQTLLATDRAALLVWTASGAGVLNLMSAVNAGNNFFVSVRNGGGGVLTITPDGSETIDDDTTLALQPGDSTTLTTDGLEWFTVGLGQQPVFAFDFTSIDLTGQSDPYVLSGSELNRIAYQFIGTLTHDIDIVVPPTYQQYWVTNDTTGAYVFTIRTAAGTGVSINQGASNIVYCNGANVVDADTASLSTPITAAQGGTGQTSYTIGDLLYASGTTALSKLADVATGNALISGGVGVAPLWGKIGLTTHVSGTLPVANGGTNIASYAVGDIIYASGATTLSKLADVATGSVLLSGGVGVAPAWGPVPLGSAVTGTLAVANGGTGQTSYTNGQLLIGNTTGNTLTKATLTAGNGISISNGTGSITLSTSLPITEANTSIAIGTSAAGTAMSNGHNVSVGQSAAAALTNALSTDNVAVGYQALLVGVTTLRNTIVGSGAGKAMNNNDSCSLFGYNSGAAITSGAGNAFFGVNSGSSVTTGTNNTFLGAYTGATGSTGEVALSTGAGTRRFWNDGTDAYVSHATTANAANAVLDSGNNKLQRSTSSLRYKRDVEPMDESRAEALLALQPIFYRSKIATDRQDWSYYGFSAEELAEIEPRFVQWAPHPDDWTKPDQNGERFPIKDARLVPDGVAYDRMVVPLLALVKTQQATIADLIARVEALEAKSG